MQEQKFREEELDVHLGALTAQNTDDGGNNFEQYQGKIAKLKEALTASSSRPRVVVVWMEHGAERAAEQIREAVPELTIIWLKSNPHALRALVAADFLARDSKS